MGCGTDDLPAVRSSCRGDVRSEDARNAHPVSWCAWENERGDGPSVSLAYFPVCGNWGERSALETSTMRDRAVSQTFPANSRNLGKMGQTHAASCGVNRDTSLPGERGQERPLIFFWSRLTGRCSPVSTVKIARGQIRRDESEIAASHPRRIDLCGSPKIRGQPCPDPACLPVIDECGGIDRMQQWIGISKVGFPRCPSVTHARVRHPMRSRLQESEVWPDFSLLASYGDAGSSPRVPAGEQKINLLAHQADVICPNAHTVTQPVGLARMLPYQAETFRVKVKIIGQPADVHQTLDEEIVEFDEQPELRHTSNHTVVLLAQLIQHELDFLRFSTSRSASSARRSLVEVDVAISGKALHPELASCRRHASRSGAVTQQAVHDQVGVAPDGRGKVRIVRTGQAEVATVVHGIMRPRQ